MRYRPHPAPRGFAEPTWRETACGLLLICFAATVAAAQPGSAGSRPPAGDLATGQAWDGEAFAATFCWCPPGEFRMGSPVDDPDRFADEGPVDVTLTSGFWIGKHEVTRAQYRAITGEAPWAAAGEETADPQRPATHVSWEMAQRFCEELTRRERAAGRLSDDGEYRLPTEAEWEYACRAGTESRFSFGDRDALLGRYAWYFGTAGSAGESYPHEVGLLAANRWNLHDVHGNVWEWTADAYQATLPGGPDPRVAEGDQRVFRGGAFGSFASECRSAARLRQSPGFQADNLGFRLVLTPGQTSSDDAEEPVVPPTPTDDVLPSEKPTAPQPWATQRDPYDAKRRVPAGAAQKSFPGAAPYRYSRYGYRPY